MAITPQPDHEQRPPQRRMRLLWLLFVLPGATILWVQYYFPKPGQVWASARRRDEPIMHVLYSLAFWAVVIVLGFMIFTSH